MGFSTTNIKKANLLVAYKKTGNFPYGDLMDEPEEETSEFDQILKLKTSRSQLDDNAEKRRQRRDELNSEAKRWAQERDKLNTQVRGLVEQAREHKTTRDTLNQQVQEAKDKRHELNQLAMAKRLAVSELKRATISGGGRHGPPVHKLKKELQELEFRQMTSELTTDKERDLIKKMSEIQDQISQKENKLKSDPEVAAAMEAASEAKKEAQNQHKMIRDLVTQAQAEHQTMTSLYRQIDELRKEADKFQEQFVKTKKSADEAHFSYIEQVKQIHDLDKLIQSKRKRSFSSVSVKAKARSQAEADELFARFMTGEKLSTEQIMTIQKAGLL